MEKIKFTIALYLFLLCPGLVKAQSKDEINLHRNVIQKAPKKIYKEASENKNEVQYLFSGLFLFYKTFFSSQDLTSCTFTPSCSEYGILSVKQYGLVMGGVRTMDRLTRCNGLTPTKYEIDTKAKLLIDKP